MRSLRSKVILAATFAVSTFAGGCTTQAMTEYVASGDAQKHSDAAVAGGVNLLAFVLGTPLALLAVIGLVVAFNLYRRDSVKRSPARAPRRRPRRRRR